MQYRTGQCRAGECIGGCGQYDGVLKQPVAI